MDCWGSAAEQLLVAGAVSVLGIRDLQRTKAKNTLVDAATQSGISYVTECVD